jgi:predicted ATP-dependent serine protease
MRNTSEVARESFSCANCGHRGELTCHGKCEACQSEQVFPDRFPTFVMPQPRTLRTRKGDEPCPSNT